MWTRDRARKYVVHRSVTLLVAALLGLVACDTDLPTSPRPNGFATESRLTGSAVVDISPLLGFVELERFAIDGTRHADGWCGYRSQRRLRRGESESEHLVQVDLANCRFVAARGHYRPPGMSSPFGSKTDSAGFSFVGTGDSSPSPRSIASRAVSLQSCQQVADLSGAIQQTIVVDPVGIQVSRDDVSLTWWYNYSCVNSPATAHSMTWFLGTNWNLNAWYTDAPHYGYFGSDPDPDYVYVTDWSVFHNPGFPTGFPLCTSDVYSYHLPNKVFGYSDGSASFDAEITIGGPACISLLDRVIFREVI